MQSLGRFGAVLEAASTDSALERDGKLRLQACLTSVRGRMADLLAQIPADQPGLTVHDLKHVDALWDVLDELVAPAFTLNPVETFVLACAFLAHDAAMSMSAWPGSRSRLDREIDAATVRLRRAELGREPRASELTSESVSNGTRAEAKANALRTLHAAAARQLMTAEWQTAADSPRLHVIEDPELRLRLGDWIGRIAESHWLPVAELTSRLGERRPAPSEFPGKWSYDPVQLACLLRASDAAQIDARRAPYFLRALRKPAGVSADHWSFQEKMDRVMRVGDRLKFTSSGTFRANEADAWWLAVDALRTCDDELRQIDTLLADSDIERLAARSVECASNIGRLAAARLPVEGWEPVDLAVYSSDVPSLVQRLGGEQLYGRDHQVVIRELLANAIDAVRARRVLEPTHVGRIEVAIRLDDSADGFFLSVSDSGIGFSRARLGDLLDFGKSGWRSESLEAEYPELFAPHGFTPTGRFGLGFWSAFMLGTNVTLTSRPFDAAKGDAFELSFRGLTLRPILSGRDSFPREWSTEVSIHASEVPLYGESSRNSLCGGFESVLQLVQAIAPISPVEIRVRVDSEQALLAVSPDDEARLPASALWRRTESAGDRRMRLRRQLFGTQESLDEARDAQYERFASNLRPLDQGAAELGSCAYVPDYGRILEGELLDLDWPATIETHATMTSNGVFCGLCGSVIGKFEVTPANAARSGHRALVTDEAFRGWFAEQTRLLVSSDLSVVEQLVTAAQICAFGDIPLGNYKLAMTRDGAVDAGELAEWLKGRNKVSCFVNGIQRSWAADWECAEGPFQIFHTWARDEIILSEDALFVPIDALSYVASELPWPLQNEGLVGDAATFVEQVRRTPFGRVLGVAASTWGVSAIDLVGASGVRFHDGSTIGTLEPIGTFASTARQARLDAIRLTRPSNSAQAGAGASPGSD